MAARFPAVDVHNHLGLWLNQGLKWMVEDVHALVSCMDELNVETIVNLDGRWGKELSANIARYDAAFPGRFVTFCHVDWSSLGEGPSAFDRLPESLRVAAEAGAAGLKVWKDLGLSVRDDRETLVLPDDPRLADLWATAAELHMPVLIHTGDPAAFWQPVDRHNERFEELVRHPDWQHGEKQVPSQATLLDSFENLVASQPTTTFIGAHLAGAAEDLGRVAGMLDHYANLVVDLSAREAEIGRQPRAAAELLTRYDDRILWGTDSFPFRAEQYRIWYRLLQSTDEYFDYSTDASPPQGRWSIYGLGLPDDSLSKIYSENARRIISALAR